ncbi:MAG: short-chain dehydrogenase/reductase, partial [Rubritepida sp.]|nr:short-chain dehydrogenase/reductase [Rubritepida sp.]
MQLTLNGRNALITGGSKGLGLAMALAFAKAGGNVALVARGTEALEAAKAEILAAAPSAKVAAISADIRTLDGCNAAAKAAAEAIGPIDILVNNAGTSQRGPFLDVAEEL